MFPRSQDISAGTAVFYEPKTYQNHNPAAISLLIILIILN